MASDLNETIRNAAARIAGYIEDVAELKVTTKYIEVNTQQEHSDPKLAAYTVIKIDGDCNTIVPMHQTKQDEFQVNTPLFDIHKESVEAAISYRSRMMESLLHVLQTRWR